MNGMAGYLNGIAGYFGTEYTVRIIEILEEDEHYGILCEVRKGKRKFVVPMVELEINDRKHPNYKLVEKYNTYFSNR